jgi:hypothetical protein
MIHAFGSWAMSQEGWGEERSDGSHGRRSVVDPEKEVGTKVALNSIED